MKAGIGDLEQVAVMTAGQLLAIKGVGGKLLDAIRVMLTDHGLSLADESAVRTEAA
jgi:DNA-directed RNA polymerase alpha subunit